MMAPQLRAALMALLSTFAASDLLAQPIQTISCMLTPLRESRIGGEQGGIVTARNVSRNDVVKKGELLVQLDDGILQAEVNRITLNHEALKSRLERSEGLARNNVIARDEIEALRTETAVAEAELDAARQRLAKTLILAPFDGVITNTSIEVGEMTSANPLMILADIAQLYAVVIVPAEAWGQVLPQTELSVTAVVGGTTRQGKVIAVDSFIDASANSFTLRVLLENPDFAMPAGSACKL